MAADTQVGVVISQHYIIRFEKLTRASVAAHLRCRDCKSESVLAFRAVNDKYRQESTMRIRLLALCYVAFGWFHDREAEEANGKGWLGLYSARTHGELRLSLCNVFKITENVFAPIVRGFILYQVWKLIQYWRCSTTPSTVISLSG